MLLSFPPASLFICLSWLLKDIKAQPVPGFQPTFDTREATIATIHNALFSGVTTCRAVVESFLARIEAINPSINALMSLDPVALRVADEKDDLIAKGNITGRLFCIPILLKDNYDAEGLNTTGSCLALKDNRPTKDAPTVAAFRNEGAIILGKSSLHELALEGLSVSSLGGQVINPYDNTRTPGGSSGGTGAAVAASLAVFGTGTGKHFCVQQSEGERTNLYPQLSDTVNSLRSPASANNLYSFRPTRGLITRAGVIPISYTQDAVGAIGRCVHDIAVALTVMAGIGYDPNDNTTALAPPSSVGHDYTGDLAHSSLSGLRFGVLEGFFNRTASPETTPVNDAMSATLSQLASAGATIIQINDTATYNATALSANLDVQQFEYRELLTSYLQSSDRFPSPTVPDSMPDLYSTSSNSTNTTGRFLVIPTQYPYLSHALHSSTTSNATYPPTLQSITNLLLTLRTTFSTHSLTALLYPEQKNLVVPIGSPSQSGRNGILAALTGSPVVTVPIGFSPSSSGSGAEKGGVPIGMEVLGRPWSEGQLLGVASGVERMGLVGGGSRRKMPKGAERVVEVTRGYAEVPSVMPDRGNIPGAYPVGVL
ncbi:MAG: hypothetical protein Q9227_001536 [Pyrenula ochraceoflavens]